MHWPSRTSGVASEPAPLRSSDPGQPEEARLPHLPALDGLRAIALVAVLAFHAGFSWIKGGYLPLTSFFVLSGFLITSLLLLERQRKGWIDLRAFWGRRARRLVPGIIAAIGLIAIYTAAVDRTAPGLRGDVWSALGWFTNWRFIFQDRSYGDLFSDPSPLQHFWSLAVEEQFYVVLPLLAVSTLWLAWGRRWLFATVTVTLIAASTLWMRYLFDPGEAPLRSYFGTDTRAAELLVGVLLAMLLIGPRGLRRFSGTGRALINVGGACALAASVTLWFVTREYDNSLYESGGLLGIALLAAVVVASGTQEGTVVSTLLSLKPLAALGRISYGVYLFHWPLFLWMDEQRTGLDQWPLFFARMAVTIGLATLSYVLLEQPIRLNKQLPKIQLAGWANASVAAAAVLVIVTSSTAPGVIEMDTVDNPQVSRASRSSDDDGLAISIEGGDGSTTSTSEDSTTTSEADGTTSTTKRNGSTSSSSPPGTSGPGTTKPRNPGTNPGTSPATTAPPTTAPPPPPPAKIMVVGDSLAGNLAFGLDHVKDKYRFDLLNWAREGCSIAVGGTMRWPGDGSIHGFADGCYDRRSGLAGAIRDFDPDVVLVESSIFDILDRQIDGWGGYSAIGTQPMDGWLVDQNRQVVNTLRSGGATVVWATLPCAQFNPTLHKNHHDNAEGNRRIDLANARIRQLGTAIADLDARICPGGGFTNNVEGVAIGRPDGVHFSPDAARRLADNWLAPLLLSHR